MESVALDDEEEGLVFSRVARAFMRALEIASPESFHTTPASALISWSQTGVATAAPFERLFEPMAASADRGRGMNGALAAAGCRPWPASEAC
ncbi:MAG: hypothetical protein EA397_19455 [Deltaproteobacteria bacterium]|nr:MAG: hypothetical protein EA397_19455 [Deltaproteobacteria bacterium]